MSIPNPLQQRQYQTGQLVQECDDCDWAQIGHRFELTECPQCGSSLKRRLGLMFGGMLVSYNGRDFHLHDNGGRFVSIEEADIADILMFMARHAPDLRNPQGPMFSATPRRVEKQRFIEDHFLRG